MLIYCGGETVSDSEQLRRQVQLGPPTRNEQIVPRVVDPGRTDRTELNRLEPLLGRRGQAEHVKQVVVLQVVP